MKKILCLLLSLVFIMVSIAGCADSDGNSTDDASDTDNSAATDDAGDTEEKLLISFSAGYSMVQHWELEMNGCQAAADELGVEFSYQFADGDEQQQVADIENMVEMGIAMLIVGPCNSEGIVPTVEELKEKGIPVMTSDIGITGTDVIAHVASDNYQIGVQAAEYMGELLDGEGKIAIVGWAAASATKDREEGFVDTMTEKFPDIEIVVNQDVGGDRNTSLEMSENIIQSNDDIDAFFGCNAECALGAYGATQSLNRTEIYIISVDSDNEVMEAIKGDTNFKATIAQDPYTMGYQAMTTAVKYLRGEEVEDIAIDAELVTIDNVQKIIDRDQAYLG